ncbi:urea ABC transporter permease subunit UrtC, partial [Cellulomonas sp.]|uniref:urea ABC transporter permease subunit UrtC n=1 Tax=Cellulomonas sp. TaxID=40001 RepID=UPI001B06D2E6
GPGGVPDFMLLYGDGVVPAWWEPLRDPVVTVLAILLLPAGVATLLGLAVFRRRVRGAYFAILSQALAAAFAILLVGQQKVTGGTNGLNGFRSFFGYDLADPVNKRMLYYVSAGVLLVMVAVVRLLMVSRFGELLVAVRDQENRVRFLGYDPANVKVVAYAVAACFAGVGGALFAPVVGIVSPADVGVIPSIGFLVGVAIGGRATLLGPVLGAIAVSWAQTGLSEQFPSFWTYFQGALFILVVAFLPDGLATLGALRRRRGAADPGPGDAPTHPPGGGPAHADDPGPDPGQDAVTAARTAGRNA